MIVEDSMPFGPSVVVGVVGIVVGTVVGGDVVVVVDVVMVAFVVVVDEPEAALIGMIVAATMSMRATVPANTRGGDDPRLFFTLPPRTRRCVEANRSDH
jgi:hypothetical protein